MKNKLIISVSLAIAALSTIAPSASGQSLKVSLSDLKSDSVIVRILDAEGLPKNQLMDYIPVKNGRFVYNLKIKTATRAYITPLVKPEKGNKMRSLNQYLQVLLVPGEQATITGTFKKHQLGGSAFFREYQKANIPMEAINEKLQALYKKYEPVLNVDNPNDSILKVFSKERTALFDAQKKEILSYIKNHPDSDVSAALVSELAAKDMNEGVALLTTRAKDGKLSPIYKKTLKQVQEQKDKEERSKKMEGNLAPAFSLPGLDGKMISLESFRGKYVVVDFWGSWCGWCIKGIPDMKKYYDKYKDKMEIVSVDCRDTDAKWREAVAKHGLTWTQVRCDGETCNLPSIYNVLGYPTKCIIDPQGKLLKVVIGESPEFYEYLDKLFK